MKTDTLTTWLGLLQAVGVAVMDFVLSTPSSPDESRWTNPMFWVGIIVAALMAVKAYYTKGIETPAPVSAKAVPVVLLAILAMGLTACASYIDYGNGRYGVTRVSEERSPFGTNAGFAYLDNCEGYRLNPGATLEFKDCHPVTPLSVISSQGQGGVIVSGALNGLGFGLGSAFSGATGATSSAVSSATAAGKSH